MTKAQMIQEMKSHGVKVDRKLKANQILLLYTEFQKTQHEISASKAGDDSVHNITQENLDKALENLENQRHIRFVKADENGSSYIGFSFVTRKDYGLPLFGDNGPFWGAESAYAGQIMVQVWLEGYGSRYSTIRRDKVALKTRINVGYIPVKVSWVANGQFTVESVSDDIYRFVKDSWERQTETHIAKFADAMSSLKAKITAGLQDSAAKSDMRDRTKDPHYDAHLTSQGK